MKDVNLVVMSSLICHSLDTCHTRHVSRAPPLPVLPVLKGAILVDWKLPMLSQICESFLKHVTVLTRHTFLIGKIKARLLP